MASAASWLKELGIPPREVCLDWAWQIQTHFAKTGSSQTQQTTALQWQRIEVGDSGELLFPSDLQEYSPNERLQELLSWSEGKLFRLDSTTANSDVESELRKLTDRCIRGNADQTIKPASPKSLIESSQFDAPLLPVASTPLSSRAKVGVTKANRTDQLFVALKQHKLAVSLASVLLVFGCYFALMRGTSKVERPKPVKTTRETKTRQADNTTTSDSSELDDSESLATMAQIPELEAIEPAVPDTPQITMPSLSSAISSSSGATSSTSSTVVAGLESKDLETPESSGISDAVLGKSIVDEPRNKVDAVLDNGTKTKNPTELASHDVMQELDALTKTAEEKTVESDIEMSNSEVPNPVSEALVLRTYPMVQTQKLATKMKVRARQPVWQLLLSVDDEFELTPAEPQDISDRQMTTWLLSDSDGKSPKVRIVIQAQAVPGRQTALRWRIFASAEDLPDLMLPLDKELLQPMQDRLRIYSQVSQREADRLKQMVSGAERDVRAVLSKQRANLESQSKLASRLTTIVAEAQLLDDLLRSQLTLYAKLLDGVGQDSPTLLQFGDPSEIEKAQEESASALPAK